MTSPQHPRLMALATAILLLGPQPTTSISVRPNEPLAQIQFVRLLDPRSTSSGRPMVLRLRNNFVVAIQVSTQVSAYDEAQIQVSHRINRHESLLLLLAPGPDPEPAPRWIGPPKERVESDVYVTESIPSGADLLFEVPWDHVGPTWSMEVPFKFDIPAARGRQPFGVAEFTWGDVPEDQRAAWLLRRPVK